MPGCAEKTGLRPAPMPNGLVSAIITCYNREKLVRIAIDSVLAQTYRPIEVIVVDDGSTDASVDTICSYGDAVRLITKPNGGTASARNAGIDAASGEYIALLDSDDYWLPEKIAVQVDVAKTHPEAGLVHNALLYLRPDGSYIDEPAPTGDPAVDLSPAVKLFDQNAIPPSSTLIPRSVLAKVGVFNERFRHREDWELFLRIAVDYPFVYIPRQLTVYYIHPDSKTADTYVHLIYEVKVYEWMRRMASRLNRRIPQDQRKRLWKDQRHKLARLAFELCRAACERGDGRTALRAALLCVRLRPRIPEFWGGLRDAVLVCLRRQRLVKQSAP
jgi:glycosyltransferase involved in cell wall biosynthesis